MSCKYPEKAEQARNWYNQNIKRAKLTHQKWYQNNKYKQIEKAKSFYQNNREKRKIYLKNYRKNNHKKLKEYQQSNKNYFKKYYQNNPEIWLRSNVKQLKRLAIPFKLPYEKYRYALMTWSKTIRKINGNRCVICGSTHKLNSHHIFYRAKYPALSLNVNNGIPLCIIHHKEVHQLN